MWKGILIEESLQDTSILAFCVIVHTEKRFLEGEDHKGEYTFHNVEVAPKDIDLVLEQVAKKIKLGWYFHLVHDNTIKVAFTNRIFAAHKGEAEKIAEMEKYGQAQGILPQQLKLDHRIEDPFI